MAQGNTAEPIRNRILSAMPAETRERLSPHLELVSISRDQVIDQIEEPIRDMFFVNRGLVSVVKTMRDGRTVEVGAVGIEGVTDPAALFGLDRAFLEAMVQIPGTAFRIERAALQTEMAHDKKLRVLMQNCARFAFGQLAQTAACNRLHTIEERCCRWLLVAHDNAVSDTFPLTQEFLAMMLGVQRSGVSLVANELRKLGLIDYSRGRVIVHDRQGLEDMACECYADMQLAIDQMLGVLAPA